MGRYQVSFSVIKKLLTYLVILLAVSAALMMAYGIYSFPDAPIRQCGETCFQGKQGQPRTRDDFEAFGRWLVITPSLVVSAIATGFLLNFVDRRSRRDNT